MFKNNHERRRTTSEGIVLSTPTSSSSEPNSVTSNKVSPQPAQDIIVQNTRRRTKKEAPRHVLDPTGDERRRLRVYSNRDKSWVEINAIKWAKDCDVDIITMSFGLDADHPQMRTEIDAAYAKGIIIFAAASNKGFNNPIPFPARMGNVVLCIYATDGYGNPYDGNPRELTISGYHFATLGIAVKSKWPMKKPKPAEQPVKLSDPNVQTSEQSGVRRKTGTSYATPIAAGIAAFVLDFARVNGIDDASYQTLRTRNGMEKIFAECLVERGKQSRLDYIFPWKLFTDRRTDEDIIFLIKDTLGNWTGKGGQDVNVELCEDECWYILP